MVSSCSWALGKKGPFSVRRPPKLLHPGPRESIRHQTVANIRRDIQWSPTSVEPEDHGITGRVVLAFYKPIEHATKSSHIHIARILLEGGCLGLWPVRIPLWRPSRFCVPIQEDCESDRRQPVRDKAPPRGKTQGACSAFSCLEEMRIFSHICVTRIVIPRYQLIHFVL